MAWIAAVVKRVVNVSTAGAQLGVTMEELKHLPDYREYSLNQDLATATALARKGSQQGMTPEERAVAGQAIGTQQSRTQRAMEQRGLGSLAAAITQSNATDAFNKLEAQNQEIKRGYLTTYGQLGSKVQALENANVTSFNQQLAMQQRELGMAAQQGFANLFGAASPTMENVQKFTDVFKKNAAQREAEREMEDIQKQEAQLSFDTTLGGDNRQIGDPMFEGDTLSNIEKSDEYGMLSPETQTAISEGYGNQNLAEGFDTSAVQGMDTGTGDFSAVNSVGPTTGSGY